MSERDKSVHHPEQEAPIIPPPNPFDLTRHTFLAGSAAAAALSLRPAAAQAVADAPADLVKIRLQVNGMSRCLNI